MRRRRAAVVALLAVVTAAAFGAKRNRRYGKAPPTEAWRRPVIRANGEPSDAPSASSVGRAPAESHRSRLRLAGGVLGGFVATMIFANVAAPVRLRARRT